MAINSDVFCAGLGVSLCLYTILNLIGAETASVLLQVCLPDVKEDDAEPGVFLDAYFLVLTVGLNVSGGSRAQVLSIAASLLCVFVALGTWSGATRFQSWSNHCHGSRGP